MNTTNAQSFIKGAVVVCFSLTTKKLLPERREGGKKFNLNNNT